MFGVCSLTGLELETRLVTWIGLALDVSSLVFMLVGFFSLTAAMIGLGNYWDAAYDTTDDVSRLGSQCCHNVPDSINHIWK